MATPPDPAAPFGASLGDRLHAPLTLAPRPKPTWTYDPPEGRAVLRAGDLAARAMGLPGRGLVAVGGAFGSAAGLIAATLARRGAKVVVVATDADAARATARDAAGLLGRSRDAEDDDTEHHEVLVLAASEQTPWADVAPDRRSAQLRMATMTHLAAGRPWSVLAVSVTALARRLVPPDAVRARTAKVEVPSQIDQDDLIRRLADGGYVRAPLVEDPGTFAVRGGLVDVWPVTSDAPARSRCSRSAGGCAAPRDRTS